MQNFVRNFSNRLGIRNGIVNCFEEIRSRGSIFGYISGGLTVSLNLFGLLYSFQSFIIVPPLVKKYIRKNSNHKK